MVIFLFLIVFSKLIFFKDCDFLLVDIFVEDGGNRVVFLLVYVFFGWEDEDTHFGRNAENISNIQLGCCIFYIFFIYII
jgi:hypothetical protein